jgi:RimJ/RimL family protein N-acetyltransferase
MTPADLDDMAALLGSSEVMAYYPRPKTRDEAAAWIAWNEENYARDGFGLWILHDSSGAFVGDCGLTWQVVDGVEDLEVGYHVLPRFQGLGLATEAALACREFARSRGIERLIAIIHPDNRPSQRVAEKMGLSAEKDTANAAGVPTRVYSARL